MKIRPAISGRSKVLLVLPAPYIGWIKLAVFMRSGNPYPLNLVRCDQSRQRRLTAIELVTLEVSGVPTLWNACRPDSGKSFLLVIASAQ